LCICIGDDGYFFWVGIPLPQIDISLIKEINGKGYKVHIKMWHVARIQIPRYSVIEGNSHGNYMC
jgi:hypothetical protein